MELDLQLVRKCLVVAMMLVPLLHQRVFHRLVLTIIGLQKKNHAYYTICSETFSVYKGVLGLFMQLMKTPVFPAFSQLTFHCMDLLPHVTLLLTGIRSVFSSRKCK